MELGRSWWPAQSARGASGRAQGAAQEMGTDSLMGERNRLVEPVHPREPRLAGELSMEKEVWTLGQEFPEREMCEVMLRGAVILRLGVDIGRAPFDVTIK